MIISLAALFVAIVALWLLGAWTLRDDPGEEITPILPILVGGMKVFTFCHRLCVWPRQKRQKEKRTRPHASHK